MYVFIKFDSKLYNCFYDFFVVCDGFMYVIWKELIYKFNWNGIGFERGFLKKIRKIYKRVLKNVGVVVKDWYGRVYMFKGRFV